MPGIRGEPGSCDLCTASLNMVAHWPIAACWVTSRGRSAEEKARRELTPALGVLVVDLGSVTTTGAVGGLGGLVDYADDE